MLPSVAILIPTKNDDQFIVTTLISIFHEAARYEAAGGVARICVINDGSTDRTPELVTWMRARSPVAFTFIDRADNKGVTYSLNEGFVESARDSDLVLRVDADARFVQSGWLRTLVSFLTFDERIGVVAPLSIFPDGTIDCHGVEYLPYGRTMILHNHELSAQPLAPITEVDAVLGVYALMRREDWEIDTGYHLWREDEDQCLAVRRKGKKVFSMAEIVVVHYNRIRRSRVQQRVTDRPPQTRRPLRPPVGWQEIRSRSRALTVGMLPTSWRNTFRTFVPRPAPQPDPKELSMVVWSDSSSRFATKWGFPKPDPWRYVAPERRNWTREMVRELESSPGGQFLIDRYGTGAREGQAIVERYLASRRQMGASCFAD